MTRNFFARLSTIVLLAVSTISCAPLTPVAPVEPNARPDVPALASAGATSTPPKLLTQSDALGNVVISPDGRVMAEANNGMLTLRETATGRLLRRWQYARDAWGEPRMLCFADGHERVMVMDGSNLTVWNTATGGQVPTPEVIEKKHDESISISRCTNGLGIFVRNPIDDLVHAVPGLSGPDSIAATTHFKTYSGYEGIVPVPGNRILAVATSPPSNEKPRRSGSDWLKLETFDVRTGKSLFKLPGAIPTQESGALKSFGFSPDGRWLAYIFPDGKSSKGKDQLDKTTDEVQSGIGRVVLVDTLAPFVESKFQQVQLGQLGLARGDGLAFVNDGKWLMVTRESPAMAVFFDMAGGEQVGKLDGVTVKSIDPVSARLLAVTLADGSAALFDLPSLSKRARTGRMTDPVKSISAFRGSLLLGTENHLIELPVLGEGQGIRLATVTSDVTSDESSGQILFNPSTRKIGEFSFAELALRRPNGRVEPIRLPNNQLAEDSLFLPGGDFFVFGVAPQAKVTLLKLLNEDEIEAAKRHLATFRHASYLIDRSGKTRMLQEKKGSIGAFITLSGDGKTMWTASDDKVAILDFPSLKQIRTIQTRGDVTAIQRLGDSRRMLIRTDDQVVVVGNDWRTNSFAAPSNGFALSAGPDEVLVGLGKSVVRWNPSQQSQSVSVVPHGAMVSENLRHYVRNTAAGVVLINARSGVATAVGKACPLVRRIAPDGRYLLCSEKKQESSYVKSLTVVDVQSKRKVRELKYVGIQLPVFSGDGRSINFVAEPTDDKLPKTRRHRLLAMDIATGNLQPLLDKAVGEYDFFNWVLAASRDNSVIAVIEWLSLHDSHDNGRVVILHRGAGGYTEAGSIALGKKFDGRTELDVSPDGSRVAIQNNDDLLILDGSSGKEVSRIKISMISRFRFSEDGRYIGVAGFGGDVNVFDVASGNLLQTVQLPMSVSSVEKSLLADASNTSAGEYDAEKAGEPVLKRAGIVEGRGKNAVVHPIGQSNQTGDVVFEDDAKLVSAARLGPDLIALLREDGVVTLLRPSTREMRARIVMLPEGHWAAATPDGRFDASSLDGVDALHWLLADEPYRPLPLELFMREYLEPNLLKKVARSHALSKVKDITFLNRALPETAIRKVNITDRREASVTVELNEGSFDGLKGGIRVTERSGVYDLRLFRDGQLVKSIEGNVLNGVAAKDGRRQIVFDGIRLPSARGEKEVSFSVYAFNSDGVKGLSHVVRQQIPAIAPQPARAVVVAVGVNRYENPDLDLAYAANDTQEMSRVLVERLGKSGRFADIKVHKLVSDDATPTAANKGALRNVLQQLAGRGTGKAASGLPVLTPDDALFIFFAGHGMMDPKGEFFLVPHDMGGGRGNSVNATNLERSISSRELREWLRDIDAGEIIMIIDACQSAGALGDGEFKPGPMGSRGLGQLAYDKGMRILAATQADDVALESDKLKHGLLTYALLREGLDENRADFRPKDEAVLMGEWLSYALHGVPELARRVQSDRAEGRGIAKAARGADASWQSAQQPSLFDFRRTRTSEVRLK